MHIPKLFDVFRTGRVLSEPFMKLPSRRELPDYYDVIKKPLDIKKIMNRIEDGKVCQHWQLKLFFYPIQYHN